MTSPKNDPHTVFMAFSGKKQTGKDTATAMAVELLEANGKKVGVTAFAEALKRIAIDVLGLSSNLVYGSNEDKETLTHIHWDTFPENIRKKYGTEYERWDSGYQIMCRMPRHGPMTVREVLQVMGTDIFRTMFEEDVWANSPFRRDWSDYDVVIIVDCRFPNEKRVTEEHGGIIIRLERDTGFVDNHPSETALDDFHFERCYKNEGSLEDLQEFVRSTLQELGLIQ